MIRRILFASSALAVFALPFASQASSPIRLELGGESTWLFGLATQDKRFKQGRDYSSTDVKGSSKLFVKGETTLDNGMLVGVEFKFHAGGSSNINDNSDPVDQSWVYLQGRLGKLIAGTIDNAAYLLHVTAPDAARMSEDASLSVLDGYWVVPPYNLYYADSTAINWTGSTEKLIYFTPKTAGFTLGLGFTPGTSNDGGYTQGNRDPGVANETYTVALNYDRDLTDDLHLSASLGWQSGRGLHASGNNLNADGYWDHSNRYNDWSAGLGVHWRGFTVGGAIHGQRVNLTDGDRTRLLAWIAGMQYDFDQKTFPLSLSLNYFDSRATFHPFGGRDRVHDTTLSAKYTLGQGIDWIASATRIEWRSNRPEVVPNKGTAVMTGLSLGF